MRPTPIPETAVWPGSERLVLLPPTDDLDDPVSPVEAVVDTVDLNGLAIPRFNLRVTLDPGDLDALRDKPHFWISILGKSVAPFAVDLAPAGVDHAGVR